MGGARRRSKARKAWVWLPDLTKKRMVWVVPVGGARRGREAWLWLPDQTKKRMTWWCKEREQGEGGLGVVS